MRLFVASLACAFVIATGCASAAPAAPVRGETLSVQAGRDTREVILYAPAKADGPVPVVLIFHGGGGGADWMAGKSRDLTRTLTSAGYAVSFMNGSSRRGGDNLRTWNAVHCSAFAQRNKIDETAYADAAIEAIANAGLRSRDIDALDAWGPGHRQIDALEVVAMRRVFGELLKALPTASIKGAIGNPLGAAGAIQVASAVMALQIGVIPPTVNWEHPDPACNLSLSSESRALFPRNVLVNAHGLSGSNASVVLTRADRLYDAN